MNEYAIDEGTVCEPCPPPGTHDPAPELVETPKAWIVAFGDVGFINIIAESQEELVGRLNEARLNFSNDLYAVEIVSNGPTAEVSTIWIDPGMVEAVMERFEPRGAGAALAPGMPPGLKAVLDKAAEHAARLDEIETVAVVVAPEPEGE